MRVRLVRAALCLSLCVATAVLAQQRACENYERCESIMRCPALARYANKKASAEEKARLRSALCGWEAQDFNQPNIPKVCCPLVPMYDCGPVNTPDKIIGGNRTVVKEFPWAARLGYKSGRGHLDYRCAGALINDRYVLTAAHCAEGRSKPVSVRLGEHDTESDTDCSIISRERVCAGPVVDMDVEDILMHPEYVPNSRTASGLWNDVALLRLDGRVAMKDSVQPVCLPLRVDSRDEMNAASRADYSLTVVGWGRISAEKFADTDRYLAKLQLRVVPRDECERKFSPFRTTIDNKRQVCAIGKDGTDVCTGDSGGPLTIVTLLGTRVRSVLRGIVSFGPPKCATNGIPAVFGRVSHHLPWILDSIRP